VASTNGRAQDGDGGAVDRAGRPVRVVLVGRTGLDESLGLSAGVLGVGAEVVPVRSGMDALGVVGRGGDGHVVVIGQAVDVEPLVPRAGRLIRALRRLDGGVRVLAVGRPLEVTGQLGDAYDGWLDEDDPDHAAQMVLRPRASGRWSGEAPTDASDTPHPPAVGLRDGAARATDAHDAAGVWPADPAGASAAAWEDCVLAQRALEGVGLRDAALGLAWRRLGAKGACELELVDSRPTDGSRAAAAVAGPGGVGRAGYVVGPAWAAGSVGAIARWLGPWLALEGRLGELARQADTDPLTGAWNRRFFDRHLAASLERARQQRRDVSVLLVDIDNFKRFNDRHGHQAGDEILAETVRLLESVIRPSDRVCRLGGDEFAVIFDDPSGPREPCSRHPTSVVDLARRFQAQVASRRFPKLGEQAPGRLTISGGLATFPWDGLTAGELVRVADARALESKRLGKNAITLGPQTDSRPTGERSAQDP